MKTKTDQATWNRLNAGAALLLFTTSALAGPRSSANYSIITDASDSGGRRATSASYTNDGSAGTVAGISTVASPSETAKAGYIGQLYEIAGFLVSASPSTLHESGTRQLDAWHLLDDATYLAINPTQVSWSVLSGPIVSVSASGLTTAGIVYQNTAATVRGIHLGNPSSFTLTVLNATFDDFESYAGDEIDDGWQVQYFGLPPNPAAAPLLDPDGDGQDNRFEWIAGLIPTDANSVFRLSIVGSFQGANLIFSPTVAGRAYTVKYGFDFLDVPNWPTLVNGIVTDIGNQRRVLDPNVFFASPKKFYRIEIE